MALTYGFYNSIEGDRVYDAIQFGRIFDGIIKDGVYATYEKGMMVIASSNPAEVIIQPGRAWFNHTWSYNDANVIFEAPAPEVLLERYDALVLEINEELSARENSYKWVTGTPSSRPERPTLTNTSTIHQYPLCYVHRYPETTMIYTRDITNMIGTSECPFATGVLEGIDLDAWINQWDDEFHTWENSKKTQFEAWMLSQEDAFTTWYNAFKNQMASDVQEVEDFVDYLESVLDASTAIHLQEEIDDLKKEISSGSHITVTTINPELYGRNVTITEAGGTVFTEKFDNTGVAVFKSVPYVGNLTISSTYGTQTAERVVNTPYYARYEFAIAFWAATVNIVGDPEMSGSTVTIKDSNETVVGTVVLGSAGTGIFTATAPDTYKFILTYGGETMEVTLSVTQETTYTVDLHANRFKWEDWLEAGGVTGSYSNLDDVLEDEKALRRLFTVHASVDYMAGINDDNEDVETIINNDLAAKWINLRDYALDTLYANTIIKGYMDTADKYFYGEWALVGQVPKMTSNTAPYGEIIFSGYINQWNIPLYAFNQNSSDKWHSGNSVQQPWIGYDFGKPTKVNMVRIEDAHDATSSETYRCKIQGYDGSDWIDLTGEIDYTYSNGSVHEYEINGDSYSKYRVYYLELGGAGSQYPGNCICELQFFAWQPKGNVPIMTSNTAPYGTASASSAYSGNPAYYAFDGNDSTLWSDNAEVSGRTANVVYHFTNPICPKKVSFILVSPHIRTIADNYVIVGSNDGTNYTPLLTIPSANINANEEYVASIENDAYYMYLGMQYLKKANSTPNVSSLQFYGRELSVSVPKMDTNTTPYGEAIASSYYGGSYIYKAFDGDPSTEWHSNMGMPQYIGYKSVNPICVKKVVVTNAPSPFTGIKTSKLQGSNTGNADDWHDIGDFVDCPTIGATYQKDYADNDASYLYHRLYITESNYNASGYYAVLGSLQFYGLDYSEKEFEEGTNKKWLYDHGVELEEIHDIRSGGVIKEASDIKVYAYTVNEAARNGSALIDLTPYSLARMRVPQWKGTLCSILACNPSNINTTLGYTRISSANTPNTLSLDVSAINQQAYIGAQVDTGVNDIYFNEFWLE